MLADGKKITVKAGGMPQVGGNQATTPGNCARPKKITARLSATQGKCDVPFSYSQRDSLRDNTVVIRDNIDDGGFSSSNSYNFHAETIEEPLK